MDKHIKVLYPITDLARDGAQRQLLELVKGLDKERFTPVVLTLRSEGPMEAEFKDVSHLELISLGCKRKSDVFLSLFKVVKIVRRMRVEVVQPFLTPATFCGLLPAVLCRTPVKIVTERASAGRTDTNLAYGLYLKLEDFLTHFADWSIANSKAGEEFLIHRGINPQRIKVIYNGLNLDRLAADKEEIELVRRGLEVPFGGKVIGMMARLFPQKRHDIFLRAAAVVSEAMPDTRFVVLGDGPLRSQLEALSNELGIASKVTFLGEQPKVGPFISSFDIAVLLSQAEGCSNSILEAMALAKPVIATDVGGNRELIEHGETGVLVPVENVDGVAQAMLTLLRNHGAASSMGQRAREMVIRRFTVNGMVKQYQALYEDTLMNKIKKKNVREVGLRDPQL